ncbi:MAG: SulP family inorganic anion transporter [Chloroherpetonaceae bacterium]
MRHRLKYYRLIWTRYDAVAGLSVFFVALPLCLGIALASNAPLYAGLVSGVIGGIIVGIISGSPTSVSGPAAGLTTVVASAISSSGDYRVFLLSVIIAGAFQILIGVIGWGGIANYFPSSVIKGMLAAIGIILISKQIPVATGFDQPDFWTSAFIELFTTEPFLGNMDSFVRHFTKGVTAITLVSLGVLVLMQQPFAHRFRRIPAPLLAVLVGVGLNLLFNAVAPQYALKPSQLVSIPENLLESAQFPDFSKLFSSVEIWKNGLVIGLLASLESLLCIEAIDKLDERNLTTPVNREMIAQGVGNMMCGLLGAIPLTAVIVRGAANVQAGAKTKLSTITHGVLLLVASLSIPSLLNHIPFASLSAILLITGYNLTKPQLYTAIWRAGTTQFLPFIITIVVILATDLLIGVSIGLLISIYFIIQSNFQAEFRVEKKHIEGIDHYFITLNSSVTFLNKVKLKKILDEIPEYAAVTIDGTSSHFIDYDILEMISEYKTIAHERHIELHLQGIQTVNTIAVH